MPPASSKAVDLMTDHSTKTCMLVQQMRWMEVPNLAAVHNLQALYMCWPNKHAAGLQHTDRQTHCQLVAPHPRVAFFVASMEHTR